MNEQTVVDRTKRVIDLTRENTNRSGLQSIVGYLIKDNSMIRAYLSEELEALTEKHLSRTSTSAKAKELFGGVLQQGGALYDPIEVYTNIALLVGMEIGTFQRPSKKEWTMNDDQLTRFTNEVTFVADMVKAYDHPANMKKVKRHTSKILREDGLVRRFLDEQLTAAITNFSHPKIAESSINIFQDIVNEYTNILLSAGIEIAQRLPKETQEFLANYEPLDELDQLALQLRERGGFELYFDASGRPDLYDQEGADDLDGIRASHNLTRGADKFRNSGTRYSASLTRHAAHRLFYHAPFPKGYKSDALAFGALPIKSGQKTKRLSDVVATDDKSLPHYMQFPIRAEVLDGNGQFRERYPLLTCVTNLDVVGAVVAHLRENPGDFYPLIKKLLPKEEFPNVNAGILAHAKPARSLTFLNGAALRVDLHEHSDKARRQLGEYTGGPFKATVFKEYGWKVAVKK